MDQPYYTLQPAAGTKETGMAYPAVVSYPDYDFDGPRSIYKLKPFEKPNFVPDLRFIISKGAKFTDVLTQATFSSVGLLVSQQFLEFILPFNVIPFTPLSVIIENKGNFIEYLWLQFHWNDWHNYLDWETTTFEQIIDGKAYEIEINSYEEFNIECQKNKFTFAKIAVYRDIPFDFYFLPIINQFRMSSNFYSATLKNKFTGLSIQ